MPNAITNRIKTYSTTYLGKEADGVIEASTHFKPLRLSDNTVTGTTEEITSDVMIPETRIPSTPELGSESNSGNLETEWNIDEQDELFEALFCGTWATEEDPSVTSKNNLTLGDTVHSFAMLKKYPETPVAYQLFTKMFVNSLTMTFNTDSFVKLSWNLMGSNNPSKVTTDPLTDKTPVYDDALTTKSFITKSGSIKIGDSVEGLTAIRQLPSMEITINNNMERSPALCEKESIENSLGDFLINGSFDCYNADDTATNLYNDAVEGKDKVISVEVERTVATTSTSYTLIMNVHLSAPTESKNGNKLQFNVPFTVNESTDLKLTKVVKEIA